MSNSQEKSSLKGAIQKGLKEKENIKDLVRWIGDNRGHVKEKFREKLNSYLSIDEEEFKHTNEDKHEIYHQYVREFWNLEDLLNFESVNFSEIESIKHEDSELF